MSFTAPRYRAGDRVRYQVDNEIYTVRAVHNNPQSNDPATYDIASPTSGKTLESVAEAALSKQDKQGDS